MNPAGEESPRPSDRSFDRLSEFDHLYEKEWAGLLAFAWTLVGSWPEAEDVVQDVFSETYRRWPEVRRLDRPGAWVRRGVINRATSLHRRRAVARRGQLRLVSARSDHHEHPDHDHTGDTAVERITNPAFWDAVRSLPERQAACIALHYLEDRSTQEIAEILDCRPGTVKAHLHRGRRNLSERLGMLAGREPAVSTSTSPAATSPESESAEEAGS